MNTLILRHRRENLAKCSLRGLEKLPYLRFYTYPIQGLPFLEGMFVLDVEAPPLSPLDQNRPFLLLDGTWNLAALMAKHFSSVEKRSLPTHFKTAYPRRQTGCPDPARGLASVEALYLTHKILGRPTEGLLDHYYWREQFLEINRDYLVAPEGMGLRIRAARSTSAL